MIKLSITGHFLTIFLLNCFFLGMLGLGGCSKGCPPLNDDLLETTIEIPLAVIPGAANYAQLPLQNGFLDTLGGRLTVAGVLLTSLDGLAFDYLQEIELYVSAPGMPDQPLAYRDFNVENNNIGQSLDLIPTPYDSQIENYFYNAQFALKLKYWIYDTPASFHLFRISLLLRTCEE